MLNRRHAYLMVLTLTILTGIHELVNGCANPNDLWYWHQFLTILNSTVALAFLTVAIPYRQLFAKTLAGLWFLSSLEDLTLFPLWLFHIDLASQGHALHVTSSVLFFFYICVKSYDRIPSDTIRDGYVYQVRAVPRRPQDMILSVLYLRPFGGTGVVVEGYWYHYRKGRLQRDEYSRIPLDKCVILETRKVKPGDRESLDSRLGEKWTWTRNCATTLHPLTVWHRFR